MKNPTLQIQATAVFEKNYQATSRVVVDEGGTGSSKSFSLAQLMVIKALEVRGKVFSVVRKTLPALKATAMRNVLDVIRDMGLYKLENHNRTDHIYRLNGNEIEFFGLDQPQKVRSRRRDFLWMNEGNEFELEDWRQLSLRTNAQIFLDYNPSDQFHWIYDEVLTRKDCTLITSTYQDNPFLPADIVAEIESYKDKDENYWRIYGLGLRGTSQSTIYTHWKLVDEIPANCDDRFFGLDFGYNNPSALVEIGIKDQDIYCKEWIYQRYLKNRELKKLMRQLGISTDVPIYADSAEPDRIAELCEEDRREPEEIEAEQKKLNEAAAEGEKPGTAEEYMSGFNVLPMDKEQGSVKKGIDDIQSRGFHITKDSVNTQKEAKSYRWKEKDGKMLDEPVKVNDHSMDAIRGAIYTYSKQSFIGFA